MNTLRCIICTILLSHCFYHSSCFAAQEPNSIDFEDPFYAAVLKASVNEAYLTESGEIRDFEKAYQQKKIIEDARFAEQQYTDMLDRWHEPNLLSSEYQDAAYWVLSHFELNEKKLLTFGLVVDAFGIPDNIHFAAYGSDESGTLAHELRFTATYKQRDIDFEFSVTDLCRAIDISSSCLNRVIIRWPQNYSYIKQHPVLYGFDKNDEVYKSLCKAIEKIQQEKNSFYHWMGYMEQWPKDFKVQQAPYDLEIMMIDHAMDNLVIICLKIAGENKTLYCNTWWKRQADKWILLNDEQASQYFKTLKETHSPI